MHKFLLYFVFVFPCIFNLILPFYIEKNQNDSLSFYDKFINNNKITDFYIGTPPKKIPIYIKSEYFPFYISIFSDIYNPNNSQTYKQISQRISFLLLNKIVTQGYQSKETFIFDNNTINDFPFFLEIIPLFNLSGILGLNLKPQLDLESNSLLYNLKNKKLISNYIWTYEFIDDKKEKGNLIIGEFPHNYNPSKYKEQLFKKTKAEIVGNFIDWYILFDTIKIGNYSINIRKVLLRLEFGLIKGTKQLEEIIINNYLKGKKYEKMKENIYTHYCFSDKSIIDNFPSIYFYIKELNETFILSKEDLFTEYQKRYYLNIFFPDYDEIVPFWILGNIFLKKYQFIFNIDQKTIGYYSGYTNNSKNFVRIIFIFILIIILIFLIYFYIKSSKKRKKRQNEINDIYEYISKD